MYIQDLTESDFIVDVVAYEKRSGWKGHKAYTQTMCDDLEGNIRYLLETKQIQIEDMSGYFNTPDVLITSIAIFDYTGSIIVQLDRPIMRNKEQTPAWLRDRYPDIDHNINEEETRGQAVKIEWGA